MANHARITSGEIDHDCSRCRVDASMAVGHPAARLVALTCHAPRASPLRRAFSCQAGKSSAQDGFNNAVVGQENVCTPATSHWASSQASPSVEATVVVSGETRSVDTISVSVIPSWLTVTDTV